MPTRSGADYHEINPEWFVCAYCYMAWPSIKGVWRHEGMVTKRETIRVDDGVDDFAVIPGRYTRIWTEPHCLFCHRQVKGYPSTVTIQR